jgi:murein DD-endopeptidase MepM/ murein hydrolase activator NlpD
LTRRELREQERRAAAAEAAEALMQGEVVPIEESPATTPAVMPALIIESTPAVVPTIEQPSTSVPAQPVPMATVPVDSILGDVPSPFVTGPVLIQPQDRRPIVVTKGRGRTSPRPVHKRKHAMSKVVSGLAMVAVLGLTALAVFPSSAFTPAEAADLAANVTVPGATTKVSAGSAQALTSAVAPAAIATRDKYYAISPYALAAERWSATDKTFTNNPNGAIQWPLAVGTPISDGYGLRVSPCAGCSTDHKGVDFTPGPGFPIQSIADGVVRQVIESNSGYGVHVIIDHPQLGISSLYAHMQHGSTPLVVGQVIKVGEFIGLTGSTGEATGPHLHFEIRINEVPVNPFTWLKANATPL